MLRSSCDQLFQPVAEVAARSPDDPGKRGRDVPARKPVAAMFKSMATTDLMAAQVPANLRQVLIESRRGYL